MGSPVDPKAVHQCELETWSRCAKGYGDRFAGLTGEAAPFVAEAAGAGSGKAVRDVGSGPGHVAGSLARAAAQVTGIEFSAGMVEGSRQHPPQVRFEQADAEELPFDDQRFDAVTSNFVAPHLTRPDVVFGEVHCVLRPGGRFAFPHAALVGVAEKA